MDVNIKETDSMDNDMVIEWLKFRVPMDQRERYVQLDDAIWTAALRTLPGFISKETWISPTEADVVIFVIRWQTREAWKAISAETLAAISARFDTALGFSYTLEASQEFQVRRFPVTALPSR